MQKRSHFKYSLLYFNVADFAFLSGDLFSIKPFALSPVPFTERIDDSVPFSKLAWKGVSFLWIKINTVAYPVFESGRRKNNMSTLKALYVRHMIPKTFLIILSIIWEFSHADLGMYRVIYYFKISELLFKLIGFSLSES